MKRAALAIVVACTLDASPGDAEPTHQTSWYFRVAYETGQFAESSNEGVSGPIMMYAGSKWRCERVAAALAKNGNIVSGFTCIGPSGWVNVLASCAGTSEDTDQVGAAVGDLGGHVRLGVRCSTVAQKTKAAPKPVDKNL
jgi:hypothetical protein